jgi:hypothetical protein
MSFGREDLSPLRFAKEIYLARKKQEIIAGIKDGIFYFYIE